MHERLQTAGYVLVERPEDADLVVLNTCSVREKAEQKVRSLVGALAQVKCSRPEVVIAVAGCVAQEHGQSLLRRMKHVDLVVGPDNLAELPELAAAAFAGAPACARTTFDVERPVFLRAAPERGRGVAPSMYVTIMKGCDERCSFCIVPRTRGPERHRPSDEVLCEIDRLVDAGVREIVLLGQTVNGYRDPSGGLGAAGGDFAALLFEIARRAPRLSRLRYTSPHPRHVTPALVRAHREIGMLARHVHLPVQSGSDAVLRRMIRRHSRQEYVERAMLLAHARPGLALTTDVIVGFPGETDRDFEQTLSLVEQIGFVGVFGFKYSPRPGTPALELCDDVPEAVKCARLAALFDASDVLVSRNLASLVGTVQDVLIEGTGDVADKLCGRTDRNEIVHVEAQGRSDLVGKVASVRIVRAFKHSLEGELPVIA
jgi:tRNA-2-methylthio-N6-dimethylallyladenosine synthase